MPSCTKRALITATLALGFALSGCSTPTDVVPTETASPTAAGPYLGFATEAEAIAAAEEVYAAYLAAAKAFWGGDGTADVTQYLMGPAYEAEVETRAAVAAAGLTLESLSTSEPLESQVLHSGGVELLTCEHIAGRVLDREGNDVTPADRPERQALKLVVLLDADDSIRIDSSTAIDDPRC